MKKTPVYIQKPDLSFYHKNSEISYDPTNKFYQVTFPYDFEKEFYDFIEGFANLLFTESKPKDFGALPKDKNMTDFYFDLLTEFGGLPWDAYNLWYYDKKTKFQEKIKKIIINSIVESKKLGIKDLEFFTWVSLVTFFSLFIEDYFHKHFEKFNIIKETLFYFLGEILYIILQEIYNDEEIDALRIEKTGQDKRKIDPLLNKYSVIYNDIASISHIEKMMIDMDVDIFVDRTIINKILHIFEFVIKNNNNIVLQDKLRNIISDMSNIRTILSNKKDRKLFIKLIRSDKDFLEKLIIKSEKKHILSLIRELVCEIGSCNLINVIRNDEVIEDIYYDKRIYLQLIRILKEIDNKKSKYLIRYMFDSIDRVKRSRNRFFNILGAKEFEKIIISVLENVSLFHKIIFNYFCLRDKYGRKSSYSDELSGIKILRQSEIKAVRDAETNMDIMVCETIPINQKTRIENIYMEGNVFYIRYDGSFYPGGDENVRKKKFFMFADLRNSTETTMKLTKDTAGFLTPYLSTVYKVSKENNGNEIYFAGDGYAAHFSSVTDCIRAAYIIHREFAKLRREAEEKIKQKEKLLFKNLTEKKIITSDLKYDKTKTKQQSLTQEEIDCLSMIEANNGQHIDVAIRRIAEEYSMPKVEIGVGITYGELFLAVIGEGNVQFNIVLSPSLTQAARLSGSNTEVKSYVENLYGIKRLPRRVFVHEKKLFNQGIVITNNVFNQLRAEVEVGIIEKEKIELSYNVLYYYDKKLERYISMSKLEECIQLKGIEEYVEVIEVFTPATEVDQFVNNWISKSKM